MTISSAALLPVLDSLGEQYNALLSIADSAEAADLQTGAEANVTRALAFTDLQVAAALSQSIYDANVAADTPYKSPADMFQGMLTAISRHLSPATINQFLIDNSAKVSRSLATLWRSFGNVNVITPANTFEDTVVTLATFTVTGAGTGTFVGTGGPLDMTLVAPAILEVEVTTDIGAVGVASFTCQKSDGTTEVKTVNFTTADDVGDKQDIGNGTTDVYKDVTLITITGCTSGAFKVQNKLPRVPSL